MVGDILKNAHKRTVFILTSMQLIRAYRAFSVSVCFFGSDTVSDVFCFFDFFRILMDKLFDQILSPETDANSFSGRKSSCFPMKREMAPTRRPRSQFLPERCQVAHEKQRTGGRSQSRHGHVEGDLHGTKFLFNVITMALTKDSPGSITTLASTSM